MIPSLRMQYKLSQDQRDHVPRVFVCGIEMMQQFAYLSTTGTFGKNTIWNQKTELDIPEKESVKYGMSMYSGDENYHCENDMYVYVCDLYVILHFLQNESKDMMNPSNRTRDMLCIILQDDLLLAAAIVYPRCSDSSRRSYHMIVSLFSVCQTKGYPIHSVDLYKNSK